MAENNQQVRPFFDEMFIGLAGTLLQDPENGYCRKILLHEYLKRYRTVYTKKEGQTQEEFDGEVCALVREIKSARKDKRKDKLVCLFFDLIKEEVHSETELLVNVSEELPKEIVYYNNGGWRYYE